MLCVPPLLVFENISSDNTSQRYMLSRVLHYVPPPAAAAAAAAAVAAGGSGSGADAAIDDGPVFTTESATTAGLFSPANGLATPTFFNTAVGAATLEVAVAGTTGGARLAPADGKSIVEVAAWKRRLLLFFVFRAAPDTGDDCPCMVAPSAYSSRAVLIRKAGASAGATGGKGRQGLGAFSPVINIENPGNREAILVLFALTFGHGARPTAVTGGA